MMRRGVYLMFLLTWFRGRLMLLGLGLGFTWLLNPRANPWDFLLAATAMKMLALIFVPMFLFIVGRNLKGSWETLVGSRMGHAVSWWWADVWSLGLSAVMVSLSLGLLTVLVALFTRGWSWHWGGYAQSQHLQGISRTIPWLWGLEDLGLMTLGFWAMGVLYHVLSLWWRTPWIAWVAVVVGNMLPLVFAGTAARHIIWWIPGPQFSLGAHFSVIGVMPPLWSLGYALTLLAGMSATGMFLATAYPWDAIPHGSL